LELHRAALMATSSLVEVVDTDVAWEVVDDAIARPLG
jgi:hypothetical protein